MTPEDIDALRAHLQAILNAMQADAERRAEARGVTLEQLHEIERDEEAAAAVARWAVDDAAAVAGMELEHTHSNLRH